MIKKIATLAIFTILILFGTYIQQSYATIFIAGDGLWGDFEGSLSYNTSSAKLDISLKNTSPVANGGYITGFVFNNPSNLIEDISSISFSNTNFLLLGTPDFNNTINAMPDGYFDIGAAIGGSFEGGGTPNLGIGVNQTATFTFYLSGSNVSTLNESSFLSTLPILPNGSTGEESFLVRFKSFNNGQSDKTPGTETPEPASLSLLTLGLLGLGALRRKK